MSIDEKVSVFENMDAAAKTAAAAAAAAASKKALVLKWIVPSSMTTASISFVASLTIIIMIFKSNLKLTTIYRRLIFGLCAFDLIQSFSQLTGSLLMPKGSFWIAIGDDISCSISGFLITIGIAGSVLYSLSISVYFLCIAKFEMEEENIRKYVEPFLHGIPILYSLSTAIYILSIDYFNPPGTTCGINPPDVGNLEDRDFERSGMLRLVATGGPIIVVFFSNCITLGVIYWSVYSQSRSMSQFYGRASANHQQSPPRTRNHEEEHNRERFSISCTLKRLFQRFKPTNNYHPRPSGGIASPSCHASNASPLAARLSRPSRKTMQMLKEISHRAGAFFFGYIFTYLFALLHVFLITFTGRSPYAVFVLYRVLLPLQGFFNLLIYAYPHVITYRRQHEGTSWFRAFWEVIKSGGDSDRAQPKRRKMPKGIRNRKSKFVQKRRDSLRKEPAVLDVEQNFVRDVERIRTSYHHQHVDSENQPKEEEKEPIGDEDDNILKEMRESPAIEPYELDFGQSFQAIVKKLSHKSGNSENGLELRGSENGLELRGSENGLELWDSEIRSLNQGWD